MKHTFKFYGLLDDRKIFVVKCKDTKGEFSTALWNLEKVPRNKCACCGLPVKSDVENKHIYIENK